MDLCIASIYYQKPRMRGLRHATAEQARTFAGHIETGCTQQLGYSNTRAANSRLLDQQKRRRSSPKSSRHISLQTVQSLLKRATYTVTGTKLSRSAPAFSYNHQPVSEADWGRDAECGGRRFNSSTAGVM